MHLYSALIFIIVHPKCFNQIGEISKTTSICRTVVPVCAPHSSCRCGDTLYQKCHGIFSDHRGQALSLMSHLKLNALKLAKKSFLNNSKGLSHQALWVL